MKLFKIIQCFGLMLFSFGVEKIYCMGNGDDSNRAIVVAQPKSLVDITINTILAQDENTMCGLMEENRKKGGLPHEVQYLLFENAWSRLDNVAFSANNRKNFSYGLLLNHKLSVGLYSEFGCRLTCNNNILTFHKLEAIRNLMMYHHEPLDQKSKNVLEFFIKRCIQSTQRVNVTFDKPHLAWWAAFYLKNDDPMMFFLHEKDNLGGCPFSELVTLKKGYEKNKKYEKALNRIALLLQLGFPTNKLTFEKTPLERIHWLYDDLKKRAAQVSSSAIVENWQKDFCERAIALLEKAE